MSNYIHVGKYNYPKRKDDLIRNVKEKIEWMKSKKFNPLAKMFSNAVVWCEKIPNELFPKCDNYEFLMLGFSIKSDNSVVYNVQLCEENVDDKTASLVRVVISSDEDEDVDEETYIFPRINHDDID